MLTFFGILATLLFLALGGLWWMALIIAGMIFHGLPKGWKRVSATTGFTFAYFIVLAFLGTVAVYCLN